MAGWVYPAVSAAVSIAGHLWSSKTASDNASQVAYASSVNAQAIQAAGMQQAMMMSVVARYNANLIKKQAVAQSEARNHLAKYNSQLILQTADYNSRLYQAELDSLYEVAELDNQVLEAQFAKARGTVEAAQGASGVLMNQDSHADVIMQIMADEALEKLVIETNTDMRVAEITNASAKGQWEARMAAQKMQYEAHVSGQADMYSASLQSAGAAFEGIANAMSTAQSAQNRAWSMMFEGSQQSRNYSNESSYYKFRAGLAGAESLAKTLLD